MISATLARSGCRSSASSANLSLARCNPASRLLRMGDSPCRANSRARCGARPGMGSRALGKGAASAKA